MCDDKLTVSPRGRRWLGAILLTALAVRLTAAYIQPAFIDEGIVYYVTKAGLAEAVRYLRYDVHPPTYNILMYPLISRTDSIFLLRLPNVLLSLGTLIMSFLLARRFCSEEMSLALTAFCALSYEVFITDAQLRTYCPMTFCLTAVWLGMMDINSRGTPFAALKWPEGRRWALWTAAGMTAACLHYQAAVSLGICALLALRMERERRRTFSLLCLSVLPAAAWFIFNRLTMTGQLTDVKEQYAVLSNLLAFFSSAHMICGWNLYQWHYLFSDTPYVKTAYSLLFWTAAVIGLAVWALFAGGWIQMRRTRRWEADLLGCSALLLPLALFLISVLHITKSTQARYAVPLTVPFLIIAVQGLSASYRRFLAAALLAPALLICLLFPFCPTMWNQYWQSTLDYIESVKQPTDIIAINGDSLGGYSFALAYDPDNITFRYTDDYRCEMIQRPSPDKLPVMLLTRQMLDDRLLAELKGRRIILVVCQLGRSAGDYDMMGWLNRSYQVRSAFSQPSIRAWSKADTYVLERR